MTKFTLATFSVILTIVSQLHINVAEDMSEKKDWEYELLSYEQINKYPEHLEITNKMERIARGDYGITGNITIMSDKLDDQIEVTVDYFRRARNENEFKSLPFKMPKKKFFDFMNNEYKHIFMNSLHKCSNLPQFEGECDKSIIKKGTVYQLKKCKFNDAARFPNHLEPGVYQLVISALREPIIHTKLILTADVKQRLAL